MIVQEPSIEYLPPEFEGAADGGSEIFSLPETTKKPAVELVVVADGSSVTEATAVITTTMMAKTMEEHLLWDYKESIPGLPEIDYPILESIPVTGFSCDARLDGKFFYLISYYCISERSLNQWFVGY